MKFVAKRQNEHHGRIPVQRSEDQDFNSRCNQKAGVGFCYQNGSSK